MLLTQTKLSLAIVLASELCLLGIGTAQTAGQTEPPPAQSPPDVSGSTQPGEEVTASKAKKSAEEEILVTGTRIRRKDLTTPAPITVISREQMQASGKVSIGDFLQSLPEQGNAINTAINNGGSGTTRVALRGLTAARTLVLLNGRRFVPGGTGANDAVDLNSIPSGAIERIEVLKDGASAIYGSDAIGGVINLITRKRLNGAEASGYAATSGHQDGTIYDLNVAAGTSGERGNALFTAGYFTQKSVMASNRSFASIPLAYDATTGPYSQGSPTVPGGTFNLAGSQVGVQNGNALYNQLIQKNPKANRFIRDPNIANDPSKFPNAVCVGPNAGDCWRAYTSSSLPADGGDGFNFAPDNYLITPQQRISLFATGDTRLGGAARGYLEASYVNRQSDRQLAAEPLGTSGEGITVSAANAYNPFGKNFTAINRRLLEFGYRANKQDIDTVRLVGGVDGTLPDQAGPLKGWFWDTNVNFGRVNATDIKTGNLKRSGLAAAVGPSFLAADGTYHCGTSAATEVVGCVPLNLFGGGQPGTISPNQITNLTFTGNARGTNQMVAAQFNSAGELFNLLSDRPVGLAVGYEYRIVSGEFIPDPVTVAGDTTGNKGDITSGHYYVHEGFGELSIPIVSGLPFAENVEASAAARVFSYSTFGTDYTYKFGARWSLIRDFTLRGTYSTGFRAPAIADLYSGQSDSFPAVKDPCRGVSGGGGPPPASCGAAADNGDNSSQLRSRVGGNPALQPETAKIFTVGVVLEPSFIKNFTATIDYFNVSVDNAIAAIGAGTILSGCYPSAGAANQRYCSLIQRGSDNRITNIIDLQTNVGGDKTAGIDLAVQYGLPPTEVGRFRFIFDGTWLQRFNRTLADGTVIMAKGNYDLGAGASLGSIYPTVKFISGVTWQYGGLGAGLAGRFISSFKECGDANGDFSGVGRCYSTNSAYSRRVDAFTSFDAYLSYNFATSLGRTSMALGVNNVLDTQPPLIYNAFANTTSPNYADGMLGRFGYVRLSQAL